MKLNLYDRNLNRVAIIGEQYISCLWSEGYNTIQNFTLEVVATDVYRSKIRPGMYVGRAERKTLMLIDTVQTKGGKIVCSGKQAVQVLGNVALIGVIPAESVVTSSIKSAFDSAAGDRNIRIAQSDITDTYPEEIGNRSFLDVTKTMCESADIGVRAVREGKDVVIEFYRPEQKENFVLSEKFGNVTVDSITFSDTEYKNYAIVLGEDGDANTIRVDVDQSGGGERYEMVVDSGETWGDDDTDGTYRARLRAEGVEALLECRKTYVCAFTPAPSEFGKKYDLGDIITVIHPSFKLQARVERFTQKAQNNKTETTVEVGQITIVR